VLIAGKGHEAYQEVAGLRTHFSDVEEAAAALAQRVAATPLSPTRANQAGSEPKDGAA